MTVAPDRREVPFRAPQDSIAWQVEAEGFDPAREHAIESMFAVGNGYLGMRHVLPLPGAWGDLFVAGVYDRKDEGLAYSELEFLAPERGDSVQVQLEPLPYPLHASVRVEGELLAIPGANARAMRRRLDLRRAVVEVEGVHETEGGRRTRLSSLHCASLADPHVLLQQVTAAAENHWGAIEITSSLFDPVEAHRDPPVVVIEHLRSGDLELIRYATHASGYEVCIAARAFTRGGGRDAVVYRRVLAVFTNRDLPDPRAAALARVEQLAADAFDALLGDHEGAWREFWEDADIRVDGSPATEQALRFTMYHLRIAVDRDPRASIPGRAFTGRAYEGHVFWDTEIFMLPFYLYTAPPLARNLLRYRHHTLDGARARARSLGYAGACFAWESTVTGEDVTPTRIILKTTRQEIPIFTGTQQVHVTADIAYAVWHYWEATHDEAFLAGEGADLLFETARFWASRVTRDARGYHIRQVVGPDEYHHDVDDNAYTNWMARFNLDRAAWLAGSLGSAARPRLGADEPSRWQEVAAGLCCAGPDDRGVIEQFAGFHALEDYRLSPQERFKAPVSRLFHWDKVNRLKLIKQPDVLMLLMLFPDAFARDVVAANYRYYEPLTDHGSSLSAPVHAATAARLGLYEDAERYWKQSLWFDLSNQMQNSDLGVHPAAMGGVWQALVFGWLGVRFTSDGPQVDAAPAVRLPAQWRAVALKLAWRGRAYPVARSAEMPGGRP